MARTTVTTSGTAIVTSRRFLEKTRTSSPTLCAWMRAPSSLCSNDASPRFSRASVKIDRRVREHRLHRFERLQDEPRQRLVPIDDCRPRHDTDVAGEHRCPPDPRSGDARRPCNGLEEDAFERTLAELARQQPQEKILLVGRGPAEKVPEQSDARRGRPGAAGRDDAIERGVDVVNLNRRLIGCGDVADRRQLHPSDPEPALPRLAGQIRHHDVELIRWRAFQQVGEMGDLREPAGCLGDGAGGGDDFGKTHTSC